MVHEELFDNTPRCMKTKLNVLPTNPDTQEHAAVGIGRFPKWLHRTLPRGNALLQTHSLIHKKRLHTVCEEAKCPNILECYSKKTATFLILGKECTRHCGFCEIGFAKIPKLPDNEEPEHIADSCSELGLKHIVITMVARDDLADGGAAHLVKVISAIRKKLPSATIETLTSDFDGNLDSLEILLESRPEIFNHNLETVKELTPKVRHKATYERSLSLLAYAKKRYPNLVVKTGIMVGLGETKDQVIELFQDVAKTGTDIVTIGQYLQASHKKIAVKEFIHPDTFTLYQELGKVAGIKYVYAGPFVRSSYNADLVLNSVNGSVSITSH